VLSAHLLSAFHFACEDDFAGKILSAMRFQFGGHVEKKSGQLNVCGHAASELSFGRNAIWHSNEVPQKASSCRHGDFRGQRRAYQENTSALANLAQEGLLSLQYAIGSAFPLTK